MIKWLEEKQQDINYITIPEWQEEGIANLFTLRHSGNSEGVFASLNMALHVGDNAEDVINNRKKVLDICDLDFANLVCCEQVHGDSIGIVDSGDRGKGAACFEEAIKDTDALITNIPNLPLATFYADCFPIYFFDKVHRVIAIAHSGWKGTIKDIGVKTVAKMISHFNCSVNDIQVFIGPGIQNCCFEIDEGLAKEVLYKFPHFKQILLVKEKGFLWDLPNTNRQALLKIGIKTENVIMCPLCTSCHTDRFFSYRKENGNTGRMAAIISLRY